MEQPFQHAASNDAALHEGIASFFTMRRHAELCFCVCAALKVEFCYCLLTSAVHPAAKLMHAYVYVTEMYSSCA